MKKLIILVILLVSISVKANPWKVFYIPSQPNQGFCVAMINSSTGCIGGGGILRTIDSGNTWTQVLDPTVGVIRNLVFYGQVGYATGNTVGWGTTMWKTTNGGVNWNEVYTTPDFLSLGRIYAINENNVVVTLNGGSQQKIIQSTDGGISWNDVFSTYEIQVVSAVFSVGKYVSTQNHLWVLINDEWVMRNNGGISTFSNTLLYDNHVYVGGQKYETNIYQSVVNKTSDNGLNWQTTLLSPGEKGICLGIAFQGFTGYAVGSTYTDSSSTGKVYQTNTENIFSEVFSLTNNSFKDVSISERCIFIGGKGVVVRYDPFENISPVELSSFHSLVNVNNVTLNWTTVSEINNSEFQIERKYQGTWETIGYVQGNGTTSIPQTYDFIDRNIQSGKYQYRLMQIDFNGNFEYFNLNNEVVIGVPEKFNLSQNYPNPFNPTTTINYTLPKDGIVTLKIFDISGKEITTLVNDHKVSGYYSVDFNASALPSGVYFYRIQTGNNNETKKMALIK